MIYSYVCTNCGFKFDKNFPMNGDEKKQPLKEACPKCKSINTIIRDYSSVSLTYDTMDVRTRARKVAGVGFDEMINNIHKSAGSLLSKKHK